MTVDKMTRQMIVDKTKTVQAIWRDKIWRDKMTLDSVTLGKVTTQDSRQNYCIQNDQT